MKFPILINHRRIVNRNLLISTPIYLTPKVYFTNRKYVSPNINLRLEKEFHIIFMYNYIISLKITIQNEQTSIEIE